MPRKHTHKLIRLGGKFTALWKCGIPGCTFFVYEAQSNILIGRRSICWECDEEFTVDENSLKQDMPKCLNCQFNLKPESVEVKEVEIPSAPPPQPQEFASEEEREIKRDQLRRQIKLHKEMGFPYEYLERQLEAI